MCDVIKWYNYDLQLKLNSKPNITAYKYTDPICLQLLHKKRRVSW